MSRSASAAPRSPATVVKRAKTSVVLPTDSKTGGPGEARDVLRHREAAIGARALGVHAALGNDLAVEVGQLLQQPDVLQERGAARACGLDVEVVDDGRAAGVADRTGQGGSLAVRAERDREGDRSVHCPSGRGGCTRPRQTVCLDSPSARPHQLPILLQAFRKEAGLTQREVALRLGVTQQTYSALERNADTVGAVRLLKLLNILGVSLVLDKPAATPSGAPTPSGADQPDW
ncbi:helix-turn-helix domain-containing protein [Ditylenchus destructor]|nr:helix-turn-helix domain-containing protein [Ditylenchus destructor]